jgi:hypothetical protein
MCIEVERREDIVAFGLVPDRLAARQRDRARIRKAAHAFQRSEIMIEGPVLLHEDHHVLDVPDRACFCGLRIGQYRAQIGRKRAERGSAGGQFQEGAAIVLHAPSLARICDKQKDVSRKDGRSRRSSWRAWR